MTPAFERQEALFATALALPAEERGGFLARECADDSTLRQRLDALLAAHDDAGDLLEPPAKVPVAQLCFDAVAPELPGSRLGHYTIGEKIGEGGGGSVYLAQQTAPVRRQVALKIVKPGMDTREVIARFEAERQALAMMDHPAIARVFEAGATDTGRPFFAMEFVRGTRITDYCDQHRCTLAERLRLFVQVCQAIQHAHHKGVVHRDIKPSNILITLHEGTPMPKVIDFGIAKATQGRLTDRTLRTAREEFVGTPAYVSPEQADGSERDIDTRSDLYSLGMLLYELLAGGTPFETKQLVAAGLHEMRRQIREVDPLRPSAQLRRCDASALAVIAAQRRTTGPELVKALAGDLDWIVIRCLEKDRARRYQTALGLARDLQRHLAHEPVEACPPSIAYTLGKFARRHRAAFGFAAATIVLLVTATAISLRLALTARQAERRAEAEAAAAKQVIAFLQTDLLAPAALEDAPVWDLKLRTVLDRAHRTLESRLVNQPLVEVGLRETLAATYRTLGDYTIEAQHWEKALALRRQLNGPEAPETLQALSQLAAASESLGRYAAAEEFAQSALEAQRRVLGPDDPATLRTMQRLATILWNRGRLAEAFELTKQTFRARSRVLGADHHDTLASMQEMAQSARNSGEVMAAAVWGRRVLDAKQRVLGPGHVSTLSAMDSLALTLRLQGRLTEAETLQRETLEARARALGPEHPDTLGSLTNLAFVHHDQGRLAEAEALAGRALAIQQRLHGDEHPGTLHARTVLAIIRLAQERIPEALAEHADLLARRQRLLGHEHPDTLSSLHYVGVTRRAEGNLAGAAAILETALTLRRQLLNPQHPELLRTMEELGRVRLQQGNFTAAHDLLKASADIRNRTLPRIWRTGLVRRWLGEALIGLGRFREADHQLQLAFKLLSEPVEGAPAGGDRAIRETAERLLALNVQQGRRYQAESWRSRLAELTVAQAR